MYGISGPSLQRLTQGTRALGCLHCGSNEHVAIESIESLPPHPGELHVDVAYACRKCQGSYQHRARFRDVAAILNRSKTLEGLFRFAGEYFHCGEPLRVEGTDVRSIHASSSVRDSGQDAGGVSMGTTVLRCRCGFRLELPS